MKLKTIEEVRYDPVDRSIAFTGKNSVGKSSKVEMAVGDPKEFLASVSTVITAVTDIPITGLQFEVRHFGRGELPYFITMRCRMDAIDIKFRLPAHFPDQRSAEEHLGYLLAAFEALTSPGPKGAN